MKPIHRAHSAIVPLYLFRTGAGGSTAGAERKHRRVSGFAVLNGVIYGLYTTTIQPPALEKGLSTVLVGGSTKFTLIDTVWIPIGHSSQAPQ